MQIYVEEWAPSYGSPLLFPGEDDIAVGVPAEDADEVRAHAGISPGQSARIAFVDGVRRVEAALYQQEAATGVMVHGVAAAHACGAVVCDSGVRPEFRDVTVSRMVVWGGGLTGGLPAVTGGWSWAVHSVGATDPEAPVKALQQRMRRAEAELAERLMTTGYLTVVDGPLSYLRNLDVAVIGYVKTHRRTLLPAPLHARIPTLSAGERSSLFRLGEDRYSCYLRLLPQPAGANPWHAIVRLELPQSVGLAVASDVADHAAGLLPRFAGIAHCDPRAPQNLQPVGALEEHLRHRLAPAPLAYRAIRDSAALLRRAALA